MYLSLDVCIKINVVRKEFPHVDLSITPSISNITISERVESLLSRFAYIPYFATEEKNSKIGSMVGGKIFIDNF